MTSKSKLKGTYHENFFVKLLNGMGLKTKRQPLSGSLGGEYSGDLVVQIDGKDYIAEVKYRKSSGFPSPFKVLDNRDFAIYKRSSKDPNWLVIIPDKMFEELFDARDKSPGG